MHSLLYILKGLDTWPSIGLMWKACLHNTVLAVYLTDIGKLL